ncbi:MAG: DUF805 domain-containing protein [Clostridia bacterium]|nr:DUF805 domain-containing protein [Clostridia bacterium]
MFRAIGRAFKNYFKIEGRTPRKDFWWYIIVYSVIAVGIWVAGYFTGDLKLTADGHNYSASLTGICGTVYLVFFVLNLIPLLTVSVRRLHDTNKSGWLLLLNLICCIGTIILFIFMLIRGKSTDNKYGPDPYALPEEEIGDEETNAE